MKITKIFTILFLLAITSSFANDKPYVILVSFDGFRWDFANRGITPNLDFIKENGVSALSLKPVFPSKTFPNHYSIITGLYPENHGIIQNEFENPFTGEIYKIHDTSAVRNHKWYLGEAFWETAERNGITTASYFWPGSEVNLISRRPSYFERYEHKRNYVTRIDGIINWLQMPYPERPHFLTLYFDATDTQGHKTGPDSPEINNTISMLDSLIGILFNELKEINLYDSTNVIIVSDHGMTEISKERIVNISEIVGSNIKSELDGPIIMLSPNDDEIETVYQKLKENENHYQVYKKESIPEYYHYSKHPFIYPIVIIAEPGWTLLNGEQSEYHSYRIKGNHGYDNNILDMHGIFFAIGPDFKKGYKTGTVLNIDIYPLLCKMFDIAPRQNIDGKLERIEFLLK